MPKTTKNTADTLKSPSEEINHPSHYGKEYDPYEVIKVVEHWLSKEEFIGAMKFQIWKYTARAGKKNSTAEKTDFKKALWYTNRLNEYLERYP